MKYWIRWIACTLTIALFITATKPIVIQAEPTDEETRQILEKSLSIVEIDHEIERIQQQIQTLTLQTNDLKTKISEKNAQIESKRDQAGQVLRAYYMGDRNTLLTTLLSLDSLQKFFMVFDFYSIIMERDHEILNTYATEFKALEQTEQNYHMKQNELTSVLSNLKEQRSRVLALQSEVNNQLAHSTDADKLKALIDELTSFWQNIGMYEVRSYFRALADAMQDLPSLIKNTKDSLVINGLNYTITLKEDDLNQFLRNKNEMFQNFAFRFETDQLVAVGERNNIKVEIKGHYTVENTPENCILFHVDHLVFNGLELPDTTRKALEKEFDLGFYPAKLVSFIQATDVSIEDHVLQVKLKMNLSR
ncbi:hypothetical protein BVG16_11235 [Paenibacillus selenitireducens]|uniref:N-terminal domain of peptidoglycan hydrolase CwlO-containing protein n=1 Tax=Paenibacillus selenitireducens TaxID=1324314 RepID=A0A1T2XFQ2_9BACL|nr:hypothetical protein [Paenibacillus selenitireducens]OPA78443.1 hypothetical protein BVG16_11235 [Paenibacillus selenitireducens]